MLATNSNYAKINSTGHTQKKIMCSNNAICQCNSLKIDVILMHRYLFTDNSNVNCEEKT